MDATTLWFNTPDAPSLCRGGGNGPNHPSQLYAIEKYVQPGMSLLDYGAGSATTYEALRGTEKLKPHVYPTPVNESCIFYRGLDIIPKNVEYCKQTYPDGDFKVNETIHKIDEPDQSWDVVYSRHVVDHMKSFEDALNEHCRVARKLVIIVLWVPLSTSDDHQIKNIVDQGKVYEDEYTNSYSKKKVLEALAEKVKEGWDLLEITENVGSEVKGHDTVIVLQRA